MTSKPESSPRISIVIPVRDDARLLLRCLRALRQQRLQADEVIVVDNGSTDGSAAVATAAGAKVVHCSERGIPAASATGYDAAVGDLILRLDADCVPPRSWTDDVATLLSRRPELDAVTGPGRFLDGPRALRGVAALVYLGAYVLATAPALGHLPLFGSNMALRKEAWLRVRDQVHRHDAEVHDDLDLAFHIGHGGRIGVLRSAPMGISFRPMREGRGFALRVRRGMRTVIVHWPGEFPSRRWARRIRHRTAGAAA